MSRYAYAKDKPDWAETTARQLKVALKAYILRSVLIKRPDDEILTRCAAEIADFLSEFEAEREEDAAEAAYWGEELSAYCREAVRMTRNAVGTMTPHQFGLALVEAKNPRGEKTPKESSSVVVGVGDTGGKKIDLSLFQSGDDGYNYASPGDEYNPRIQEKVVEFMRGYEEFAKSKEYSQRVNPRNIAEMTVRYESQQLDLQRFRAAGIRLVYVPPHANCSRRCQPWQGRVYSLDGSEGTQDGHRFVPIEEAVEVYYTSPKTGKRYPAGLFSYNCRHTLEQYRDGQEVETIPADVVNRQRALEELQREQEREIRKQKTKLLLLETCADADRGTNKALDKQVLAAKGKVAELEREYRKFGKKNNLTIFPERLKVVPGEYDRR